MAKYYVESGQLQVVVQARGPISAAAKALSWTTDEDCLEDVVTVNERGFLSTRSNPLPTSTDLVLETGTLMCLIEEHELF